MSFIYMAKKKKIFLSVALHVASPWGKSEMSYSTY